MDMLNGSWILWIFICLFQTIFCCGFAQHGVLATFPSQFRKDFLNVWNYFKVTNPPKIVRRSLIGMSSFNKFTPQQEIILHTTASQHSLQLITPHHKHLQSPEVTRLESNLWLISSRKYVCSDLTHRVGKKLLLSNCWLTWNAEHSDTNTTIIRTGGLVWNFLCHAVFPEIG